VEEAHEHAIALVIFIENKPENGLYGSDLGKDLVRVWPLPMQSHWFEDCWEPVDGEIRNQLEGI
jgi:ABC-type cobalt transport system substrate-binding protein